jgi:sensor histidine kinase YesM
MTVLKLTTPEELSIRGPARISGMVGVKILYFWIIALVCRLINKKIREIPSKHWIIIISMPVVSILVLYTLAISYINLNGQMTTTLFLLAIAGLSFINIAFFDFFENYNKQLRISILEQVVEHENTNYKQLENAYSEMRKLKHDVSNQVTIINDLITRNEKDSASEVIQNLSERLDEINYICYTGEPIIDSIINIKLKSAHDIGIKVSKNIAVNKFSLDCFELCRALGNALDNSIEACQRYEKDEKYIHMSMQQIEDKIAIEISNSSDVVDPKNLQTKKKNKSAHNIGMSSIKTSVKKLGGYISYDFKDNIFYLKIVVLNK